MFEVYEYEVGIGRRHVAGPFDKPARASEACKREAKQLGVPLFVRDCGEGWDVYSYDPLDGSEFNPEILNGQED